MANRGGLILVGFLEGGDDAEILQGAGIARDLLTRCDIAQEAAHDLARARLGQGVGEADIRGPGDGADFLGNVALENFRKRSPGFTPPLGVTKATTAVPVISSGRPTTAASATSLWETRALSTSMVPIRWPEMFITSSMRPMIQK